MYILKLRVSYEVRAIISSVETWARSEKYKMAGGKYVTVHPYLCLTPYIALVVSVMSKNVETAHNN